MTKVFDLIDLDCANCAAKMERKIAEIEGVREVSVRFMTQKLHITADDDKFDDILRRVVKVCKRVEPDCKIVL